MTTGDEIIERLGLENFTYIRYKKYYLHPCYPSSYFKDFNIYSLLCIKFYSSYYNN